jgi:hypothetical protein
VLPSALNTGPASQALFDAVRLRALPLPSACNRYRSKLVERGSSALDRRALTTSDLPSGAQARSDRSPNGLDGTSATRSAPTSVADSTGALPPRSATKMRLRRPSAQVSQWRMKRRSKTTPLLAGLASSFFLVQSRSPLQPGKAPAAKAMRLPSGDSE